MRKIGVGDTTTVTMADKLAALQQELNSIVPTAAARDRSVWDSSKDLAFSVASCYAELRKMGIPCGPHNIYDNAFASIWKVDVPLKVRVFRWRCFANRIPWKDPLLQRGIINLFFNLDCVFCGSLPESYVHLFMGCHEVKKVWI